MLNLYIKIWTDRQTDIKTDNWTPIKQLYTPNLSMWGHKNLKNKMKNSLKNLFSTGKPSGLTRQNLKPVSLITQSLCRKKHKKTIIKPISYHTILTFNDPEQRAFWKYYPKRRKCW